MEMELRMSRIRDENALVRALLLLALTGLLAKLVARGELSQYIHPKFTWFTASAALGLTLMALGQLRRWWRGSTGAIAPVRYRLYTAITVVVCGGLLLQPHTFGADLAAKQGLNVTNRSASRPAAAAPATPDVSTPAPAAMPPTATAREANTAVPATAPAPSKAAEPKAAAPNPESKQGAATAAAPATTPVPDQRERIEVTPQNFMQTMFDLYDFPEKHAGKRLAMDGFVFYPPDVGPADFAIVRLVVTCHVAHAYPDGLVAYFPDGAQRPKQDTWYRVEGILEPFTYRDKATLRLKIEKATPIEQPADPYVYP